MYSLNYKVTTSACDSEVAAKLGEMLVPTIYRHDNIFVISLSIGEDVSAIVEFS